jgi:hypothetical protein
VITALHLLARDSDFQASWYLSAVIFGGIVLAGWAMWLVLQPLRGMWRRGDRGLAFALGTAVTVAFLMFASMLTTVAIALLPLTRSGGAG